MNKSELVDAIAANADLSKVQAAAALDAVTNAIGQALKSGDSVTLVGFGTFGVKERAARLGRNPKTGEALPIPASKVPGFKPGKGLKDLISSQSADTKKPAAKPTTATKPAASATKSTASKKK